MLAIGFFAVVRVHNGFACPSFKTLRRDFRTVFAIALPAILTNVATPAGNAFVTREMAKFGTDAVAGMAIIGRMIPVAFAVVFALSGAIGPIVGQNFGAEKFDRVKGAFIAGIKFIALYVAFMTLALYLLRAPLADLFDATGQTRDLIYLFCGGLAALSFFNGVIFVANASFNNLGRPVYSTTINWGRNTLGTWPFVAIGAAFYGAEGVLLGQAVGGIFFAAFATIMALRLMNRLESPQPVEPFTRQRRLLLLFGQGRW
jgi:Na+-driven multidrug efflux pump